MRCTMIRMTARTLVLLASLAGGFIAADARACPACKDTLAGGDTSAPAGPGSANVEAGVPSGFNSSVYLMLSGFLGTLGLVGLTLYRGVRTAGTSVDQKASDSD